MGIDWQRKGGDIAIETCRILNNQGIKSMIHIIGPVEVPESCKNIPYIEFIGFLNKNNQCDYERIIQYMSSSDILLLPTKQNVPVSYLLKLLPIACRFSLTTLEEFQIM